MHTSIQLCLSPVTLLIESLHEPAKRRLLGTFDSDSFTSLHKIRLVLVLLCFQQTELHDPPAQEGRLGLPQRGSQLEHGIQLDLHLALDALAPLQQWYMHGERPLACEN